MAVAIVAAVQSTITFRPPAQLARTVIPSSLSTLDATSRLAGM